MNRKLLKQLGIAAAIAIVATAGVAAPAVASASRSSDIGAYVKVDGVMVALDKAFAANALDLASPAETEPGTVSPQLIDWNQWFGCFQLNNEEDEFALYTHWWDGVGKDIRLKCGAGGKYSGWGYKHIRDKHEADWQAKLDAAVITGGSRKGTASSLGTT